MPNPIPPTTAGEHADAPANESTQHYAYIDALRGLAFMGVLSLHVRQRTGDPLPVLLEQLAMQGGRGVQLFFVISSLTLILSCRSRFDREHRPLSNFFLRRFFRIVPMFWFGLVFYFCLEGWASRYEAPAGIGWWHLISTATLTHGWHPTSINSVVPGGWSIAVEMTYYLLIPLLVVWVVNLRRATIATVAALVAAALINELIRPVLEPRFAHLGNKLVSHFLFHWFPNQLPVFLLGFVLYHLMQTGLPRPKHGAGQNETHRRFSILLLILAACMIVGFAWLRGTFPPVHFLYGLAFVALTWGLSRQPIRLLVNRPLCLVGKLSYSCYLCHFALLDLFVTTVGWRMQKWTMPLASLWHFLIFWVCMLIATVVVATVTYRLIEMPGMALGKRVIGWNEHRGRQQPTA